jgi:hypothetical protein
MTEPFKLEAQDLRKVWDEIKPGLEEIKSAWPESCTWRVEDVYAAISAEQAVVYTTEEGFAVCTIETDQYTGEDELYIWIAYSPSNKRGGILQKYLPSFIEVAKRYGCTTVTTSSNHPAVATVMEPIYTKYRVVIDGCEGN